MRALGTAEMRSMVSTEEHTETQQQSGMPPTAYAIVDARDARGNPTHLWLPGPLAGNKVQLSALRGGFIADVLPDGTLKSDGMRGAELAAMKPGTRIVAATDAKGRVLALSALVRVDRSGKSERQRAAASTSVHTRSDDQYKHNPHEVVIRGGGYVLRKGR